MASSLAINTFTLFEEVMITTVIFDVDGALLDSNGLPAEAWAARFAKYGKHIDGNDVRR